MKILQYKTSLKNKLAVLVMIAVMMVVAALGVYFDSFLKKISFANAQAVIFHSYQRLVTSLNSIEKSLKDGVEFIQTDEQISASIELINNYEDKKNYNTYLIDEEKKLLVNEILNRVKFTFNDNIALYNKNNEVIAFVEKEPQGYRLNYISYSNSKPLLYQRYENEAEYKAKEIDLSSNIPFNHIFYYKESQVSDSSVVSYHQVDNNIIIKSHQNIIDSGTKNILGYIEMSRILDMNYFSGLSTAFNIKINYTFDNSLNNIADKWSKSFKHNQLKVSENNDTYFVVLKQTSVDSIIYYLIELDKKSFNVLLNENRSQLLIFLALVTFLILFLMRYIINLSLSGPLSTLAEQINKIEKQDYSESNTLATGDEMETVSKSINKLAQVIQAREIELKNLLHEQTLLSTQVKESEARLLTLIQTLPDLIWLKDLDGVYLSCNKNFEQYFGKTEEEIVGKTDYDFVDKELADFFREKDKSAMAAGKPTMNEEEVIYATDGHKELLETIKTPMYDIDGKVTGVLGVGRNITERKEVAEKLIKTTSRLEKIASRVPGMVYQFELRAEGSMHFPYISDAIQDVYHLTAKEVQDDVTKIFAVVHPDDVDKVNDSIAESAKTLQPWKLEYRICDKDGTVRWLFGNSIPEKNPNGDILWHGFVTDITKNKEIDESLRRTEKMDALGKLTGGIAHDYNNMLGVVLGYAEILKDMLGDRPELQGFVDEIMHAADRGSKLTNKLLSFSRQQITKAEYVDVNSVINGMKNMLEKTLTARIEQEYILGEDIWTVCLDEGEFEDALLNLSINAMHAMENAGKLTIETKKQTVNSMDAEQLELKQGEYVVITVTDTGCGLDAATKEKIFDPFYSSKGEKGTGLGLTQVYAFIKRAGGAIKVESQPEQGAKFILYFPRHTEEKVITENIERDSTESVNIHEPILIVDDESSLLKLACEILSLHGYEVYCAESAKQALEVLESEKISVVLTDIIMPGMDGYELASIIKEKYPAIKIQLTSGFTGDDNNKFKNDVLTKSLLKKPYSEKELLSKLKDLLL